MGAGRAGRHDAGGLRRLDAARALGSADRPRHERVGARPPVLAVRGRARRRLAALHRRARPLAPALVGLGVEAAAARAAVRRAVRRAAVVPARCPTTPARSSRTSGASSPPSARARPRTSTGPCSTTSARSCRSRTSAGPSGWATPCGCSTSTWATEPAPAARRNASPLALPADAYDAEAAETVRQVYAADFEVFGYDERPPRGGSPGRWDATSCCRCCAGRSTSTCGSGSCTASRSGAPSACRAPRRGWRRGRDPPVTSNLEEHADFNVRWGWDEGPLQPGADARSCASRTRRARCR